MTSTGGKLWKTNEIDAHGTKHIVLQQEHYKLLGGFTEVFSCESHVVEQTVPSFASRS